ncbi:MAG: hypothetical protein PHU81_01860 [Acidobacteriota bacterium]|nr:hypothetical protein [Acidobacteriota bacterium]
MKKRALCLVILMLVFLSAGLLQAQVQQKRLGLGIILGEPTGVIAKYWTGSRTAFDIAGSWSFSGENAFHLHADYLLHSFIKVEAGKLAVYYGIGARLNLQDDARFGAKIPLGLSYMFENSPLEVFFEISPVMDLIPDTKLRLLGFVGVRYFF